MQFTDELPPDLLELRIYAGADADYALYEDDGTSYAYEKGARATIPLHWNEARQTLTVGERIGTFPGMLDRRTFHVSWVRPGHGVGDTAEAKPDRVVSYAGRSLTVGRSRH